MREQIHSFDFRQTMERPNFEVFHYHDESPRLVELHHHDFYELYFFLGGRMDYRVEGQRYSLQPGDILLMSPMELHMPIVDSADGKFERIVLWVQKEYIERFAQEDFSLTRCFDASVPTHTNLLRPTSGQRADISILLSSLLREAYSKEYGSVLTAQCTLIRLLVEINRLAQKSTPRREEQESPLISKVVAYINEHYHEVISLEDLAQRFYVSKFHLSHEFSRVVGTGVYRYVTLKRLLIAKHMISSGVAPGVACLNCGFSDYANFYRAFKTQYGISPSNCAGK